MISYFASSSDSVLMNTVDENNIFVADCVRKIYAYSSLVKIFLKKSKSGIIFAWNSNHNSHVLHVL